jgi:16S rRNA (cytosine967-C5)-methyltransferase
VGYIREVLSTYGGLDRVVVLNGDSTLLEYRSIFDKALLDVPCTGTGAIYSDPTVKIRFSPLSLEWLKRIQLKLLRRVLRNSGRVIYISCSILPDEGELIVDEAIRENLVEPVPLSEPYLSKAYKGFKSSDNTYRIMPHIVHGQGMYLAVLESKVHTG